MPPMTRSRCSSSPGAPASAGEDDHVPQFRPREPARLHQHRTLLLARTHETASTSSKATSIRRAPWSTSVAAGEPWMQRSRRARSFASSISKATRPSTRCSTTPPIRPSATARTDTIQRQGALYLTTGSQSDVHRGQRAAHHRRRHLRPARHARRRLRARRATSCATRSTRSSCTAAATASCRAGAQGEPSA